MSSVSLIRPPAWLGLTPGLPEPVAVDTETGDAVRAAFRLSGRVAGLVPPCLFRLDRGADGPPLVLKLVEPGRCDSALRAEAIASWLAARGLPVPAALPGFPRNLADGRVAVALPFVEGRRLEPTPDDLSALGRAVGALHCALAQHPDRATWAAATARRLAELTAMRTELAAGRFRAGPEPERVQALAADRALDFAPAWPARPLHGDLNPGNILVEREAGRIVLLDFEDVFHGVLPAQFELLLLIERHILLRVAEDALALALIRRLLEGYGERSDAPIFPAPPADILRARALRSLCVLALGAREGRDGGDSEWAKFLALEQQAQMRAGLLARALPR
jgi:Ser/Thr protein kinase RdoA (MazF antagonist)